MEFIFLHLQLSAPLKLSATQLVWVSTHPSPTSSAVSILFSWISACLVLHRVPSLCHHTLNSTAVVNLTGSAAAVAMAPAMEDVVLAESRSPFKGKKGIPVWYKGKISPAFERHIFWPSPPKKNKSKTHNKFFPACASSSLWRQLYAENKMMQLNKIH